MTLRVGLSGAGFIAPYHIHGWRKAGISVVAIVDPDIERVTARAAEFAIPSTYSSVPEMLSAEQIDILDIASPRKYHVEQALAGLRANLPTMVQKPVAPHLSNAEELSARMKPNDKLMVHENWRFRPDYRQIGRWLSDGKIGRVRFASMASRSTVMLEDEDGHRPIDRRQPFLLLEERLVVAELLIHYIDTLRYLIGEMTLIAASGWRTQEAVSGETAATLVLNADIGINVMLSADMTAYGCTPGATDDLELIGESGRILLREGKLSLHSRREQQGLDMGRDLLQESVSAAIRHFVDCSESGQPFETNIIDNLRTLRIVEDAYGMMQENGIRDHF